MTESMKATIRNHVQGKVVWDLGAGNLWHSHMALELGANRVIAVEKEPTQGPWDPRIEILSVPFERIPHPIEALDVAYLSWPINRHTPGLLAMLSLSRTVIYLGSNTGGNACGTRTLFNHLLSREVLGHVPHPRNTLIIYGGLQQRHRPPLPEEWAALHDEQLWEINEVTAEVASRFYALKTP